MSVTIEGGDAQVCIQVMGGFYGVLVRSYLVILSREEGRRTNCTLFVTAGQVNTEGYEESYILLTPR